MATKFFLEIITPEKTFFEGNVESLVINAIDGEMGILAGMMSLVTQIAPGELRYFAEGKWHYAYSSEGFVEVRPEGVIVLSQEVERPEDIDRKREEKAIAKEEEILRQQKSLHEYRLSQAALVRAFERLRVKNRRN